MRVYGARSGEAVVSPHVFKQALTAQHLAGIADEVLQQLKLHGRKLDLLARADNTTAAQIDFDIAERVPVMLLGKGMAATQDRLDPGHQLANGKGLGDIVICPEFEAHNFVDL